MALEWLLDALFEDEVVIPSSEVEALVDISRQVGSSRYSAEEIAMLSVESSQRHPDA